MCVCEGGGGVAVWGSTFKERNLFPKSAVANIMLSLLRIESVAEYQTVNKF